MRTTKPSSPNAKYYTLCTVCEEILFRIPIGGGKTQLGHVVIEGGKAVGFHMGRWCPRTYNEKEGR